MRRIKLQTAHPSELTWLTAIQERSHPINEQCPIWVRHGVIDQGPTCAHPERHPYYEFGTNFAGVVTQWVRKERTDRLVGDIFLAGPGLPHWSTGKQYPHHFATVFFLPTAVLGMGPVNDGAQILRRFTMKQDLASHLVRPPPTLCEKLLEGFREMIHEFEGNLRGREVKLRSILTGMIIELLRWEQQNGLAQMAEPAANDWRALDRALQFLHERFREPVYANDVAKHCGLSESRLKTLFHDVLGLPWSRYLQSYRIYRALDYLGVPGYNVTEAALAVGFESLSHFNSTFRAVMDMSPREYSLAAGR